MWVYVGFIRSKQVTSGEHMLHQVGAEIEYIYGIYCTVVHIVPSVCIQPGIYVKHIDTIFPTDFKSPNWPYMCGLVYGKNDQIGHHWMTSHQSPVWSICQKLGWLAINSKSIFKFPYWHVCPVGYHKTLIYSTSDIVYVAKRKEDRKGASKERKKIKRFRCVFSIFSMSHIFFFRFANAYDFGPTSTSDASLRLSH